LWGRRGRDEQDFRRAGVWALAIGAGEKDEAGRAVGDIEGGNGEALLQVVATERKDDETDRRMAHETGRERVGAAAIGLGRIVVDRGAPVEPLGDHLEIRPKLALQDAGPSLRARKSA